VEISRSRISPTLAGGNGVAVEVWMDDEGHETKADGAETA